MMISRSATVWKATDVGPIIDGEEIFKALEKSIANAQRSVLIAFWSVDPDTKLVSEPAEHGSIC